MYESLFIVGIIFAVLAGGFLIATVSMFFGFNIPALRKDVSGSLEQKQIEEIRKNSSAARSMFSRSLRKRLRSRETTRTVSTSARPRAFRLRFTARSEPRCLSMSPAR